MQTCIIPAQMFVVRKGTQLLACGLLVGLAFSDQKESSGQEQGHT